MRPDSLPQPSIELRIAEFDLVLNGVAPTPGTQQYAVTLAGITTELVAALAVDANRLKVLSLRPGSIIAVVQLLPSVHWADPSGTSTLSRAATELAAQGMFANLHVGCTGTNCNAGAHN